MYPSPGVVGKAARGFNAKGQGRFKVALMAKAWTMQGWPGPLAVLPGYQPERSGAHGGKRTPQAKRAPHPFRPAGRRTVRASGPCHPGLPPLVPLILCCKNISTLDSLCPRSLGKLGNGIGIGRVAMMLLTLCDGGFSGRSPSQSESVRPLSSFWRGCQRRKSEWVRVGQTVEMQVGVEAKVESRTRWQWVAPLDSKSTQPKPCTKSEDKRR